jgi:hypothetical protein
MRPIRSKECERAVCCVLGPVKSGTTMLISLLDDHPALSAFPMEVKFLTHWIERFDRVEGKATGKATYEALNGFFFKQSKIRLMDQGGEGLADIMNSGRIDFTNFDFKKFRAIQISNAKKAEVRELSGRALFRRYFRDIHDALEVTRGRKGLEVIVSKEGNHGAKHISTILAHFPHAKFIVVVRDPRDIYVSLKSIARKKRAGLNSPSFKELVTPASFIIGNQDKNILAFSKVYEKYRDDRQFHFVRYEALVADPAREMGLISSFLEIDNDLVLQKPTNFGQPWKGNASSMNEMSGISTTRTNKWKKDLTKNESELLEHGFGKYLRQGGYGLSGRKPNQIRFVVFVVASEVEALMTHWTWSRRSMKNGINHFLVAIRAIREGARIVRNG